MIDCSIYSGIAEFSKVCGKPVATRLDPHIHLMDDIKEALSDTYELVEICPKYREKVWHGRLKSEEGEK